MYDLEKELAGSSPRMEDDGTVLKLLKEAWLQLFPDVPWPKELFEKQEQKSRRALTRKATRSGNTGQKTKAMTSP